MTFVLDPIEQHEHPLKLPYGDTGWVWVWKREQARTPDLMAALDEAVKEAQRAAQRQAVEDLIAWALDHDPARLEAEREDAWRRA